MAGAISFLPIARSAIKLSPMLGRVPCRTTRTISSTSNRFLSSSSPCHIPPPRPSTTFQPLIPPHRAIPLLPTRFASTTTSPLPPPSYQPSIWTRVSTLRSKATSNPNNVEAQLALFHRLLVRKEPSELIGRYEELTGILSQSPTTATGTVTVEGTTVGAGDVLKSDECFRLYLVALAARAAEDGEAVGESLAKITEAPRWRETLLSKVVPPVVAGENALDETTSLPSTVTPTPVSTTSKDLLSPSTLITALFSGSRGKGGTPRIISGGSSFTGLGLGTSSTSASSSGSEPIRIIIEEAKSPLLWRALRFIFITALYSFLLLSLLSLLLDSSGILRATTQTTPFSPTAPPDPNKVDGRGTTFKDVWGCDEAKGELNEVVEFLKDPTRFEKLGGRLPRGILLTGPPGTGKTLLARAVAGEAGVNFFSASGSEFDEMYVGVGARRIRELFAAARKAAPAIIFLDEIDAIGGKRSPRDQHYVKQTLNQLLVELDGFSPGEGVILIGATNFPESLDKALIRPGRFDRHIVVPLPDVRGRMQILTHHMRNVGYDKQNVDISMIARGTIGFSGADLQALVNQAAVKASADNAVSVRASHFEWAKERIMMGAARKSAFISEKDKLATAYHEGGHALVALYTPGAYPLQSVTVVPRGMALGYTLMLPEMDKNSHSLSEYRAKLDVAMGGRVAEELIYGRDNVTDGASSDISSATQMASAMVRRFGFSDAIGPVAHPEDADSNISPQTQATIESEVRGLIESAQARAKALLLVKKIELERLAKALVEHETLDAKEVARVVKGEKILKRLEDVV